MNCTSRRWGKRGRAGGGRGGKREWDIGFAPHALQTREATRRLLTAAPLPQTSHARWKLQFAAAAAAAAAVLAHSASRCFFAVQAWKDGSNLERRQQPAATCTNLHQP
ncbi:hypothetical protein PMIN03_011937 [Paraphaeosphaeria minitans]